MFRQKVRETRREQGGIEQKPRLRCGNDRVVWVKDGRSGETTEEAGSEWGTEKSDRLKWYFVINYLPLWNIIIQLQNITTKVLEHTMTVLVRIIDQFMTLWIIKAFYFNFLIFSGKYLN